MGLRISLIGNPNCGKTTLFNALTGSNQYVGNWAGVTVEKKTGIVAASGDEIVDLPGIYSLSPYSLEEKITRRFLIEGECDGIINIIDGTNIERNLYLTVQLIHLNKPMVVAVNMYDDVVSSGGSIDCEYISKLLGIPVIPISARKNENVDKIMPAITKAIDSKLIPPEINYDSITQNALNSIYGIILRKCETDKKPYSFFAGRLLEGDTETADYLSLNEIQRRDIENIVDRYERASAYRDREALLADARYRFVEEVCSKTVIKKKSSMSMTVSEKIDRVVTSKYLAIPFFLLLMGGIFTLTFGSAGTFLSGLLESLINDRLVPLVSQCLVRADAPQWCRGLLIDAVIGGVGNIIVFLPQIAILFFCLSVMEDSGYMARAAFITDRFLRKLGLSGKSFIPMIMGFGCTTPAVMATRTQENTDERRMTIMLIPFMSCGAKLPIYALFAGVFFKQYRGLVVMSMYLLGFTVAVIYGLILKKTLFKSNKASFLMELPPYRVPLPKSLLKNTWEKCRDFLTKAGTIIFAMSIVIWVLQNFSPSFRMVDNSSESIFGQLGMFIAPIFVPLGFGNWQSGVSILSGLVAKEAVVSTMSVLYGTNSPEALSNVVSQVFTPLSAYAFMAFCLLYMPCISAFATIKREMGSIKWALLSAGIQIGIAYTVSLCIYQIGTLIERLL